MACIQIISTEEMSLIVNTIKKYNKKETNGSILSKAMERKISLDELSKQIRKLDYVETNTTMKFFMDDIKNPESKTFYFEIDVNID